MGEQLSFDATNADGTPRKFAGMWRPPFEEWLPKARPFAGWYHVPEARDAWLRGEGDRPLYEAATK